MTLSSHANSSTPRRTLAELLADQLKTDPQILGAKIGTKVVDLHTPIVPPSDPKEIRPLRPTDPDGLTVIRHSTAHVMADAVQRLFPGTKVTIGPAIDDGFYYDFDKPQRPLHRGGPRAASRKRCARSSRRSARSAARWSAATRRDALFEKMGETFKLEHHRRHPRGRGDLALPPRRPATDGDVGRRLRGPARPAHRPPRRGEADERRRRVLARRRAQPDAPAHLRHGVPDAEGARRAPQAARGGQGARPPQARQGARALHVPRVRAGDAVLPAARRGRLQPARRLHARACTSTTATTRSSRRRSSTSSCSRPAATSRTTTRTCTCR